MSRPSTVSRIDTSTGSSEEDDDELCRNAVIDSIVTLSDKTTYVFKGKTAYIAQISTNILTFRVFQKSLHERLSKISLRLTIYIYVSSELSE